MAGEVSWLTWDENALKEDSIEIAVQINGKVRGRLTVSPSIEPKELEALILKDERTLKYLGSSPIRRFVHVPKKLVNIIV